MRAAIAESFERIHRSNLVMMGIIPLEFMPGETMASLGLTGEETFTIRALDKLAPKAKLQVEATSAGGDKTTFNVLARVDDSTDLEYVRRGGILQQVLPSGSPRRARDSLRKIERGAGAVPGPKTAPAR